MNRWSTLLYNSRPVAFELKEFDDETGSFVGFASIYGNEDLHGDVVEKGAFTKTIQERPTVKILFNHNTNLPIGVGTLEDTELGLVLRGKLNLGTQIARDVYSNLKAGVLDALSIGYDVVKQKMEGGVRKLKELKLWEVSVVTIPANQLAHIIGVKGAEFAGLPAGDLLALTMSRAGDLTEEVKAGRVLSAANLALVKAAHEALAALMAAASALSEQADPKTKDATPPADPAPDSAGTPEQKDATGAADPSLDEPEFLHSLRALTERMTRDAAALGL